MIKPLVSASLALAALVGLGVSGIESASARDGRNGAFVAGAAAGAIGGAIIGSEVNRPYGYDEPRYYHRRVYYSQARCHIERRVVTDDYSGETVIHRIRVCSRPGY